VYSPRSRFGRDLQTADLSGGGPFLDRARAEREREHERSSALALGGYLVVRVVHCALAPQRAAELDWQLEGACRYVAGLPAEEAETAHLRALVAALDELLGRAAAAPPRLRLALVAYAAFLEEDDRLREALEVVVLAERSGELLTPVPAPEERLPLALAAGRLHRLLMHWADATAAFERAAHAAAESGDLAAGLHARLGRAAVLRDEGRLDEARAEVEGVIRQAGLAARCAVAARAYADLAAIHAAEGRRVEALQALYQAVVRTDDHARRIAMLTELGRGLAELGAWDGARAACEIVLAQGVRGAARLAAHLELLRVEAGAGNRVAFERHRHELRGLAHWMTPETALEARWRVAQGLLGFDQPARAREAVHEAMALAETHHLADWYFRLEQLDEELAVAAVRGAVPGAAARGTTHDAADPAALQLARRVCAYAAALVA
jgi:tetratricopeptide (TPR) repeat protein